MGDDVEVAGDEGDNDGRRVMMVVVEVSFSVGGRQQVLLAPLSGRMRGGNGQLCWTVLQGSR
jgi:hypothetical protein